MSERRARRYDPSRLDVIVKDRSHFDRSVISVVLRSIGVRCIHIARSVGEVVTLGASHDIGCVIVGGRSSDPFEDFVSTPRVIRHMADSSMRAVPIIGVIDAIGAESLALGGMDAGMDLLLVRPLSPELLERRLRVTIQSPQPLIEGGGYCGPCRRRRRVDAIFAPGRRRDDESGPGRMLRDDAIGRSLGVLGGASSYLAPGQVDALPGFQKALASAYRAASDGSDVELMDCLDIYGGYVLRTLSRRTLDPGVVRTSMMVLMQVAVMPQRLGSERRMVADELVRAVSHRAADRVQA